VSLVIPNLPAAALLNLENSTMRGRETYFIARPFLRILICLFRLFPKSFVESLWWTVQWQPGLLGAGLRYAFASRLCNAVGDNVLFNQGIFAKNWAGITIGNNVTIQQNAYLDGEGGITIGNDTSIAHAVSILSFEHTWGDSTRPIKDNPRSTAPVIIGNDVWIGCGVRILSGTTIGDRTVVAAGAVVVKGSIGGAIYGGVPARKISTFSNAQSTPASPVILEHSANFQQ